MDVKRKSKCAADALTNPDTQRHDCKKCTGFTKKQLQDWSSQLGLPFAGLKKDGLCRQILMRVLSQGGEFHELLEQGDPEKRREKLNEAIATVRDQLPDLAEMLEQKMTVSVPEKKRKGRIEMPAEVSKVVYLKPQVYTSSKLPGLRVDILQGGRAEVNYNKRVMSTFDGVVAAGPLINGGAFLKLVDGTHVYIGVCKIGVDQNTFCIYRFRLEPNDNDLVTIDERNVAFGLNNAYFLEWDRVLDQDTYNANIKKLLEASSYENFLQLIDALGKSVNKL